MNKGLSEHSKDHWLEPYYAERDLTFVAHRKICKNCFFRPFEECSNERVNSFLGTRYDEQGQAMDKVDFSPEDSFGCSEFRPKVPVLEGKMPSERGT
jgi:hypothetical protein